jgi:hypothetical protein
MRVSLMPGLFSFILLSGRRGHLALLDFYVDYAHAWGRRLLLMVVAVMLCPASMSISTVGKSGLFLLHYFAAAE